MENGLILSVMEKEFLFSHPSPLLKMLCNIMKEAGGKECVMA